MLRGAEVCPCHVKPIVMSCNSSMLIRMEQDQTIVNLLTSCVNCFTVITASICGLACLTYNKPSVACTRMTHRSRDVARSPFLLNRLVVMLFFRIPARAFSCDSDVCIGPKFIHVKWTCMEALYILREILGIARRFLWNFYMGLSIWSLTTYFRLLISFNWT